MVHVHCDAAAGLIVVDHLIVVEPKYKLRWNQTLREDNKYTCYVTNSKRFK